MSHFFKVKTLDDVLSMTRNFDPADTERVDISDAFSRILAQNLTAPGDMPGFRRATMDGFAVNAAATFGASESTPAWLEIQGTVLMGQVPDFELGPGKAVRISTGGMLPKGTDAVVMVEHTQTIDDASVEIYKSVAPLQHVIDANEDFSSGDVVLEAGTFIRPQEAGLAAGLGFTTLPVHRVPVVGIISTGDEIIPIDQEPAPGRIRDINSYALSGFVQEAHAKVIRYGIVKDDPDQLQAACEKALAQTDMVLISGGSSVGTRDYTVEVLSALPDTRILVHGMSVSPGKPTILAKSGTKPVWGLPGQVVSAMVVMKMVVIPFLNRIQGYRQPKPVMRVPAILTRNVASAQGRRDFVRVMLENGPDGMTAKPVLGKSGLIRTMIHADGLLDIGENLEGLEKHTVTQVILL
ncbi:molybdopterin molybdotransferase MoeA [Desulfotignum balticum]|jgi:molybdopterin molybdotransferase|uniref:molybdopterin molybdotransferase MoeA n=1 Tax=Desulfotignum balticum TaxID=115781 RepID=UPI0004019463|nr:gephyrin-like molybdotransferase Glp [Desulfotignum balticum]